MSSNLELARAHVAKGRQLVQEQRERLARLKRTHEHEHLSSELLKTFENTLRLFEADLARLEAAEVP